ncbi:hypothetical protein PAXINDRAFT_99802 [Paxillus involutus ATCC 200175]|uniref:Uncharacterized protein n=1 Tax=Paxillus involutus ATCC 200175 TaxID=664439 RepID=A0A0C9U7A1_PAXIN|nr:hypothetical protein PAXINDRAFT_99802 [Paxillus involutus ATCC 200175]
MLLRSTPAEDVRDDRDRRREAYAVSLMRGSKLEIGSYSPNSRAIPPSFGLPRNALSPIALSCVLGLTMLTRD